MAENSMTASQLTGYLKQIANLETSIYMQKEVLRKAQGQFEAKEPILPKKLQGRVKTCQEPEKPDLSFGDWPKVLIFSVVGFIISLIVVIVVNYCQFESADSILSQAFVGILDTLFSIVLAWSPVAIVASIVAFIVISIKNSKIKAEYKNELKEYESEKKEIEAYNKQASQTAEKRNNENLQAYQNAITCYNANKNAVIAPLTKTLEESERRLDELYARDVIFEKYRYMVAMTSMYEYFASGRVSALTGHDGAYNLFESELRQNIIICELNTINRNLETIKSNQYILYSAIKKGNEMMESMMESVRDISNTVTKIADTSEIMTYCSTISAANLEY